MLGLSRQAISRFELESQPVSARIVVASELIFGESFSAMFPRYYASVEDEIGARALDLATSLEDRDDAGSKKKLELLAAIRDRVQFATEA